MTRRDSLPIPVATWQHQPEKTAAKLPFSSGALGVIESSERVREPGNVPRRAFSAIVVRTQHVVLPGD